MGGVAWPLRRLEVPSQSFIVVMLYSLFAIYQVKGWLATSDVVHIFNWTIEINSKRRGIFLRMIIV